MPKSGSRNQTILYRETALLLWTVSCKPSYYLVTKVDKSPDSPPFFLQNSSSEEAQQNGQHSRNLHGPSTTSLPPRAGILQLSTDNGSTEDFRSVIDDLTIENKKLKRKLKGYQKLQDSHLKDQKLFEVRFHSLPVAKKRELEEVLRKFAQGLPTDYPSLGYPPAPAVLPTNKSGSSSASASNPLVDSAYASASTSGQGSSGQPGVDSKRKRIAAKHMQQDVSIQTFLHGIPEGLLPRHSAPMTDKAKKKLIVRRLEQIFAGKGAIAGSQHAGQQQEVSQLAARAERNLYYETKGHQAPKEGIREAQIMPETQADGKKEGAISEAVPLTEKTLRKVPAGLDQRPTRPLDLDPYRAQIPAENIKYMEHLGFSPPGADVLHPYQDGHGWIYLNLLSNMAQLHTINVTTEFVRKAVQDYSQMFEMSPDGRKVRWKGGKSVTKTSSDGDESRSIGASGSGAMSSERGSPSKRLKMSEGETSEYESKPSTGLIDRTDNKLAYTPLFYHRSSNGDDSDSSSPDEVDEDTSPFPPMLAGDSSGMASSGFKPASMKRNRLRETGPIIFYNNAKFCTDLSGDVKTEDAMMTNASLYHSVGQPVGIHVSASISGESEGKGPIGSGSELPEAMDLSDNPIPQEAELTFPDQSPLSSEFGTRRRKFEFEVSGLGGVCPADNFTINVQSMHARIDDHNAPTTTEHAVPPRYPERISGILQQDESFASRKARTAFHKKVLRLEHEVMPPSRLPDASLFMTAGDTTPEDDDMSTAGDDLSDEPISINGPAPSAAPQMMELDYLSTDDEDDDNESEGSLDLLATAREIDPDAIRAREREYDANMAERLAEEIPAGSSAATAGGGSGFASPASNVDRAEWEAAKRSRKEAREQERRDKKEATKR